MEILTKRLIAFFGLSVLLLSSGIRADALPAGAITMIPSGEVSVRMGREAWRPVSGTESLSAGSEVRTSGSSTAELRFSDGSRVLLTPGTLFKIDKTDAREASFSLGLGKIRAAFSGMFSSRVRIRTPTAVAAVRGTVFEMGADEKGSSITMAEGVLEVVDNQGKEAVLTSEETLRIGENGMEKPQLVALNSPEALQAVRSYAVHQESARDATRSMLEDLRNRELKANEAQLGKDVIDAFGRRVRLEEYLLRPDTKSFKVLFLSHRAERFDWGYFRQDFNSAIPNDLSQVPAIVAGGFLAKNQPSNWLKSFEFYATNTIDALKETMTLGDPTQIDFAGYNGGVQKLLWYPESIDYTQTLIGPGVPGGSRVQFQQHQDYNLLNPSLFTWTQRVQPTVAVNTPIGDPSTLMVAV
ncbi:MAG: FecR family protein, partial [Elusimicrobiota bacterium]